MKVKLRYQLQRLIYTIVPWTIVGCGAVVVVGCGTVVVVGCWTVVVVGGRGMVGRLMVVVVVVVVVVLSMKYNPLQLIFREEGQQSLRCAGVYKRKWIKLNYLKKKIPIIFFFFPSHLYR
jgi:hypothetical protein